MENYIITGASGFLGNNLAQELIKRGNKVTISLRTYKYLSPMYCKDAGVEYGDIRDISFLRKLIKPNSVVIHCAGITALGKERKNMFEVNYEGTKNIVDVCIEKGVKKFVYVSSTDVIPQEEMGHRVLIEPTRFDIERLKTSFAKSKALASQYVLGKAKDGKLNANVVYPSCLIGPGDHKLSNIGQIIIDYMNKKAKRIIDGDYNFVDVRDVVDGIIRTVEKAPSGEDYILAGREVSFKELFGIINGKIGRETLPKTISVSLAIFLTFFINFGKKVADRKKVYTPYYIKSFLNNHNFSSDKAFKELGYQIRPLAQSISDAIDWYILYKSELIEI